MPQIYWSISRPSRSADLLQSHKITETAAVSVTQTTEKTLNFLNDKKSQCYTTANIIYDTMSVFYGK